MLFYFPFSLFEGMMAKCYWIVFGFSGFSPDSSPQIFSSFIVLFVEQVSSSP